MKRIKVSVPWREGLHLRPAAQIVKRAQAFKSSVWLRVGQRIANARSITAVLLLCASMGAAVDLEVSGSDEKEALDAMMSLFDADASEPSSGGNADGVD